MWKIYKSGSVRDVELLKGNYIMSTRQTLKLTFVLILILVMIGCSTSFKLSIRESENPGIKKIYYSGFEEAVSVKDSIEICTTGGKTEDGYLQLWVYCKNNKKEKTINLIPEDITVWAYNDDFDKIKLYVYPADKFLKKLRNAQEWALIGQRITAALDSYNAGQKTSTTYGTSYGNVYDSKGNYYSGSVTGTYTTNTYDAQAASETRAKNQQILNQQTAQYNSIYNAVDHGILKSVTLFPGQQISGNVMIDYSSNYSESFHVFIPIGNNYHRIVFIPKEN